MGVCKSIGCSCKDCPNSFKDWGPNTPWTVPSYPSPGCTCNGSLLMIPPEGCWLTCPAHGSYFVRGPITY